MPRIIEGTYEILREIGSGGGGTVYLARHLRLDKQVVVKADKRKLTAKPESLRREVDALKNLSHGDIPQVYDFVRDDETVYTVMDYIEGESLDKPLKRGERPAQAQVTAWARRLLDALNYLHTRPPHGILHADIKPANIMLTPQGDIRLIDFNIALALGEDGAVSVGRSLGYASPEHLGLDFTPLGETGRDTGARSDARATTVLDSPETVPSGEPPDRSASGRRVMLDARSDIYGLGATLYHLLTGRKPAHHVRDVTPLTDADCSLGVAVIVNKAMNPNPDLRYRTAAEMLDAFERLHENDPRAVRFRRRRAVSAAVCVGLFLLGTVTAFAGLKGMQSEETLQRMIEQAKNSANESEKALADGDRAGAVRLALDALPGAGDPYDRSDVPEAAKALADALGVYDLSDGYKAHRTITLPSEVLKTALSPDGRIAAALSLGTLTLFETDTATVIAELETADSALAGAAFIDADTLVYAGADGLTAYSVADRAKLWTGDRATMIAVSADGRVVAATDRAGEAASIYTVNGKYRTEVSFGGKKPRAATNDRLGDPGDNLFALNADGSRLAVSFSDGSLRIFDLENRRNDAEPLEPSAYTHFEGGFSGPYFAFSATGASESRFAVIDTIKQVETIGTSLPARIGVTANESGVYMSYNGTHVRIDPLTAEQTPTEHDPAAVMAGGFRLLSGLDSPAVRVYRFEGREDAEIFGYDPAYRHDEARLSHDRRTVMLFGVNGFRLYGADGALIKEVALPDPGNIYDQQYRRAEADSRLEVTYYDGTVRTYSAASGEPVSEIKGESPDQSLYEEFICDEIKITAPLHGTPEAYSLKTGKRIRALEKDAYLTYVTQTGEFIVTEYISVTDDSRYGLLLDGKTCETLARLPDLCDVVGDRLIFDIRTGSLRETRIYTTAEMMRLAE